MNLPNTISNHLVPEHIYKMSSLCQLRFDPSFNPNIEAANALIAKFAYDMRHKPRINIPFVAEVDLASPESILAFIQEWIFIPESPYFQIKFSSLSPLWLETFNDLCERQNIRHVFYEFSSKANHHAHIKIKIHDVSQY